MNPTEIEFAVRDLIAKPYDPAAFPFDLVGIYNASKVTVSRLKGGHTNAAKQPGDVLWKKHLFFRPAGPSDDVGAIGDALAADPLTTKHKPRFVLVTNGEQVHARDLRLEDTLNVEYARLDESSDFLLPLAGHERRAIVEEHPADIKAAKKLKKLYDSLLAANPTWSAGHHAHELSLLMTRLLFCFYAEKTGIFAKPKIFTNTLTQHTSENGSDVASLLDRLFRIMNVEEKERPNRAPVVEANFPYVNGSLFQDTVEIPRFTRTARRQMLECGDLDWTTINPDIFGSMIQTVAQDGTRGDLGIHYTSVPNIMKVLRPLFLDDLHDAYEKAKDSVHKLEALLGRLSKIRIFDPACGSGNFLIIAYKELRKLEIETLTRIVDIAPQYPLRLSGISLQNFYGIDVIDFACETAKLSLWIAEHQMNLAFREIFGNARPALPLATITNIHCKNALRVDWFNICPEHDGMTFVCGNPPYAGSKEQRPEQKRDIEFVFAPYSTTYKKADFIGAWFVRLAAYIQRSPQTQGAFVATNSICQGEQVPILWPVIYHLGASISFAYASFTWDNNASHNAGVTCIIVGLSSNSTSLRSRLFSDETAIQTKSIGPYLVPNTTLIIGKAPAPLNGLPKILFGNKADDWGHLTLTETEYRKMVSDHPEVRRFIRRFYGSQEILQGIARYCLWIEDDDVHDAMDIQPVKQRIQNVQAARLKSSKQQTIENAAIPHKFAYRCHMNVPALAVPKVSSERRQYLQISLLDAHDVANGSLYVVYDPPPYLTAILSSRLHRIWTATVGGRMRTDIQYSNSLVYNTFPLPALSDVQKQDLGGHSATILKARARYPGKTLGWLYDPDTMPWDLLSAHQANDSYIEEHIYGRRFRDDTERLEHLFRIYEITIKSGVQRSLLNAESCGIALPKSKAQA